MRKCIGMLVGAFVLTVSLLSQAAVVEFSPSVKVVASGAVFTMDIVGTGFGSNLDGGGLDMTFDRNIVSVLGVTLSPNWEFPVPAATIDNATGIVSGLYFASAVPKPSDFPIATLQFKALALGTSPLVLSENSLNPFASGGVPVAVSFVDGSVHVVPEPATSTLVLAGLLLAVGVRRVLTS